MLFSSQGLLDRYARCQEMASGPKRGHLYGVRGGPFAVPSPVAGYVGALDSWFDIEAMEAAAAQNPDCRFILAGRVEFEPIRRLQAFPTWSLPEKYHIDRSPNCWRNFGLP